MRNVPDRTPFRLSPRFRICFFLSLFLVSVFAQNEDIQFDHYTTDDGLNQSSILAIHQDPDGFLWFGTYAGLNRFDGNNFKGYRHLYITDNHPTDMHIRAICQDQPGILWIASTAGINRFFAETGEFANFSHNPDDPHSLTNNTVYDVLRDRDGEIWLATWGGGLNKVVRVEGKYSDEREVKYQFQHFRPDSTENSISSLFISDLHETPDGIIWLATNKGLNKFDKSTGTFTAYTHDPADRNGLTTNDISAVCSDNQGNIWIGTWGEGLSVFHPGTGKFLHFRHNPRDARSLGNDIIMSLFCDKKGTIWVGTWGGGLSRLNIPET
ncbi:MAG: hypothetical protein JW801_02680, partial [Bacteroidales bacterium]|nr:hypothetical protein [Bacteroidales bacterium]